VPYSLLLSYPQGAEVRDAKSYAFETKKFSGRRICDREPTLSGMTRSLWTLGLVLIACTLARGQWQIQDSHSTAGLRGIANVDSNVAWASGTNGTVLRTVDGGENWQQCPVPPGAENLDFRGVQAFDANTAIVMSSGKGDLSRLYKTIDGCKTWRLLFTNPDADGFWTRFGSATRGTDFCLAILFTIGSSCSAPMTAETTGPG